MSVRTERISRNRRQPSVNIVPLVDVLTVLLFFFLVTMQFKKVSTLNITVPKIETAGENRIQDQIVIALSSEGTIFLNDQPVDKEQFETAMKLASQLTPNHPIVLMADEEVPLKHLTALMDICRSHQMNKIRLQSR